MKRERIQFLVTCSIGYSTPAERREAIATARQDLLAVRTCGIPGSRPVRATLVKKPHFRPMSLRATYAKMEADRGLRVKGTPPTLASVAAKAIW